MKMRRCTYSGAYAYSDYIRYIAIPYMGFTYGKIEYYSDGILVATGEIKP